VIATADVTRRAIRIYQALFALSVTEIANVARRRAILVPAARDASESRCITHRVSGGRRTIGIAPTAEAPAASRIAERLIGATAGCGAGDCAQVTSREAPIPRAAISIGCAYFATSHHTVRLRRRAVRVHPTLHAADPRLAAERATPHRLARGLRFWRLAFFAPAAGEAQRQEPQTQPKTHHDSIPMLTLRHKHLPGQWPKGRFWSPTSYHRFQMRQNSVSAW
jgi:hypothetical protein